VQGGAALRRCRGDRPSAAGAEQADQRSVARCAGRGHRQHGRDHRDPGAGGAGMSVVLVINSGSSSLKYSLIDPVRELELANGLIERIGQESGEVTHTVRVVAEPGQPAPTMLDAKHSGERPIADHDEAFSVMLAQFAEHGPSLAENPPVAVGHRVVHGGARFFEPTLITRLVEINIEDLIVLAPLHNPANLAGIRAARTAFADVPHVAVFDTAFHQTLPAAAYTYAIDAGVAREHRIR